MSDEESYGPRDSMFAGHSQAPLIVLGTLLGLFILLFFGIILGLVLKRPGGMRAWLGGFRNSAQRRRERNDNENTENVGNVGSPTRQPHVQAPLELHIMRPTITQNGGGARRGENFYDDGVVWDAYHLIRREEGRGSALTTGDLGADSGAANGAVTNSRPGRRDGHANKETPESGVVFSQRTVPVSNVWPGHGVGPGN